MLAALADHCFVGWRGAWFNARVCLRGLCSFEWEDYGGWLYPFVIENSVKYIGLTRLRSRMSNYSHIRQSQTERLRRLIHTELIAGRIVHVFGLKEADSATLLREESRLISLHRPPWNRTLTH